MIMHKLYYADPKSNILWYEFLLSNRKDILFRSPSSKCFQHNVRVYKSQKYVNIAIRIISAALRDLTTWHYTK
ncbi:hypothetical protein DERF_005187 [Dermatophagoides farinae]|uniref:Uncharacterized protein n=1 Tax=Dermatophagoides farinae TaxID=6954 RepID=A0A922I8V9_DERFA|nr:hypothetical protein DERF_012453 [Dermatophagoides farinae]KAH9521538.1 hypothetical protein DERF_005187 [Dermatophagoides farinae]